MVYFIPNGMKKTNNNKITDYAGRAGLTVGSLSRTVSKKFTI